LKFKKGRRQVVEDNKRRGERRNKRGKFFLFAKTESNDARVVAPKAMPAPKTV
jgi:hypothetical protein